MTFINDLACYSRQNYYLGHVKRIWYLSPMRAAKVQASLRIRAVSPEPPLLAHTSSASRGTFRQKASSLAPLNGWACAVKICHDGMLEDTNSLDAAHLRPKLMFCFPVPDWPVPIKMARPNSIFSWFWMIFSFDTKILTFILEDVSALSCHHRIAI